MLSLNFIRENQDIVNDSFKKRNMTFSLDELLGLDEQRRDILSTVETLKMERNQASKEIGKCKQEGKDASEILAKMENVSKTIKERDITLNDIEKRINNILLTIPNIPHAGIPVGGAEANKEIASWGEKPKFDFTPKPHWELAEKLDIIDFKRGAKLTGSGFILYKGLGARLERALINFMLDVHVEKHRYTEVSPPFVVNRNAMQGTGQIPKLEEDMYRITEEDLFLIPTAEVPVTNIFSGEILNEEDLPINYTAYTPCFRREAGSYGKDTKGINRVHQFDKVEMVKFVTPQSSYKELESLLKDAEDILQLLKLPYRTLLLASGDISFAAAKCYDLEVWSAGQEKFLEVSSCSNFEDFQSRRANIRYRTSADKKVNHLHTLNASGVALPRTMAAILENYQRADGSIKVPDVLLHYMGCSDIR